jgi:hypothetical protein
MNVSGKKRNQEIELENKERNRKYFCKVTAISRSFYVSGL